MTPHDLSCAACSGTGIEPESWPPVICAICAGGGRVPEDKNVPGCLLMSAILLGCVIGGGLVTVMYRLTGN